MGLPIDILKGIRIWNTNFLEPHRMLLSGHDDVPPISLYRNEEFTSPDAGSPVQGLPLIYKANSPETTFPFRAGCF